MSLQSLFVVLILAAFGSSSFAADVTPIAFKTPYTLTLKAQTKASETVLAAATVRDSSGEVTDGFVVAIICQSPWLSGSYSADLVFPTSSGELTLDSYNRTSMTSVEKSSYRTLSEQDANVVCQAGFSRFDFRVEANATSLMQVSTLKARSFKQRY